MPQDLIERYRDGLGIDGGGAGQAARDEANAP